MTEAAKLRTARIDLSLSLNATGLRYSSTLDEAASLQKSSRETLTATISSVITPPPLGRTFESLRFAAPNVSLCSPFRIAIRSTGSLYGQVVRIGVIGHVFVDQALDVDVVETVEKYRGIPLDSSSVNLPPCAFKIGLLRPATLNYPTIQKAKNRAWGVG